MQSNSLGSPRTPMRPRRAVAALTAAALTLGTAGALVTQQSANADPVTATPTSHLLSYTGETGGTLGYVASRTSCDVNGDGYDDTIVGDPNWDRPGYANVGAGYVLLGGQSPRSGDVADPANNIVRIDGPEVTVAGGAWLGWGTSCLGDVNGDGFDDFALGSGSTSFQKVWVVFGAEDFQSVDVEDLGTNGFTVSDTTSSINFGYWVGSVGDVNGDGYADIGIGDLLADPQGRANAGRVWVVSGSDSVRNLNVTTDTDRVLFSVDGGTAGDRLATVDNAGDVNGDGTDDFVVSAYTATPWGSSAPVAGAGYVIFGDDAAAARTVDLANLGDQGFAILGATRGRDRLGMSIAPAGDVNGDGLADLVIGGDGVTQAATGTRNGGAAVVFGSASSATVMTDPTGSVSVFTCTDGAVDTTCAASAQQARGYWIEGGTADLKAGFSVAGLGDVNGDDVPDQLVGTSGSNGVWVVYGQRGSTATIDLSDLAENDGLLLSQSYGRAIGNAGDHDGNGVTDVLMGNNGANAAAIALLGDLLTETTVTGTDAVEQGTGVDLTVTVAASVPSANADLSGVVSITRAGDPVAGCIDLPAVAGTPLTCAVTGLEPGSHDLAVSFTAADGYADSTASHRVTVSATPTDTPTASPTETPTDGPTQAPTGTPSASPTSNAKASLKFRTRVAVKKVKAGTSSVAVIRLGRTTRGTWPTGKVRVKFAGVTRTVTVNASQRGVLRVVLAKKARFTKKPKVVAVRYLGNATTKAGVLVRAKVRVTRR